MTDDPYPQSADNVCCLGHLGIFGHHGFLAPAGEDRNPHGDFPSDEPGWLHCRLRSHGQTDPTSSASWARPTQGAPQQRAHDRNLRSNFPWVTFFRCLLYAAMFWRICLFGASGLARQVASSAAATVAAISVSVLRGVAGWRQLSRRQRWCIVLAIMTLGGHMHPTRHTASCTRYST